MPRYTQADLDRVNRQITAPLTTESGGERITRRKLDELLRLQRDIEDDLARGEGRTVHRVSYARFKRD